MAAAVLHCNGDSVNHEGWTVTYQTSSSAAAEGPRNSQALKSVEILSAAAQLYEKSHLTRRIAFHVV